MYGAIANECLQVYGIDTAAASWGKLVGAATEDVRKIIGLANLD
jgi:hypothetical protein